MACFGWGEIIFFYLITIIFIFCSFMDIECFAVC